MSFGGQNRKISNIWDNRFVAGFILRHFSFFVCILSQNWTFQQPSNIAVFLPKNGETKRTHAQTASLKRYFLKNVPNDFLKF